MTYKGISYNWSDAWLLLAIINASKQGEATLETIIAAGDGINFAVFEPEEIESGLARLTDGGYVEEKNGIVFPTDIALAYTKESTKRRAIHKDLKDIETMLGAPSAVDEQPSPNNLKYAGFSMAAYDEVVKRYVAGN
jgi:hypothetical protein